MLNHAEALAGRIDGALARRAAEWPDRGQGWADFVRLAGEFAREVWEHSLDALDEPVRQGPEFDEFVDRPVVICGAMKSGTTLLLSLLDGHADLVALPGDTHMAAGFEREEAIEALAAHWVRRLINPTAQPPYWCLGREVRGYARFVGLLRAWHALEAGRASRGVRALVRSLASGAARAPVAWVEKTPENEFRVGSIRREFPSARFLSITRDPRSTLAALKRLFARRGWEYSPPDLARRVARSLELDRIHAGGLAGAWKSIRYEDLCADPERAMREVAGWMGVAWDPILLRPTQMGREAASNSMFEARRVRGRVLAADAGDDRRRWTESLDAREIELVTRASGPDLARLGYEA